MNSRLFKAIHDNDLVALQEAARSGEDLNSFNRFNTSPLELAIARDRIPLVLALLEAGADVNAVDNTGCPLLTRAVIDGSAEAVRILLDAGADPNTSDPVHGWTPIMRAVLMGDPEVVKLLKDRGARIDTIDKKGRVITDLVMAKNHEEILAILRD